MLYICCIYVVYMLYIYCIYVVYMLYICCIYVVYMLYICCIYVGYVILSFRLNLVSDNGLLDVFVILSIDS